MFKDAFGFSHIAGVELQPHPRRHPGRPDRDGQQQRLPQLGGVHGGARPGGQHQIQPLAPTPALLVHGLLHHQQQPPRQPEQAAVLVRGAHRHGHPVLAPQEGHPLGDLPVHHVQVSLLRAQQEGLAELHPPQPQPQRVLREGASGGRRRTQGQLLDAGPPVRGHVRERQLPAEAADEAALPLGAALPQGLLRGRPGPARPSPGPQHLHPPGLSSSLLPLRNRVAGAVAAGRFLLELQLGCLRAAGVPLADGFQPVRRETGGCGQVPPLLVPRRRVLAWRSAQLATSGRPPAAVAVVTAVREEEVVPFSECFV